MAIPDCDCCPPPERRNAFRGLLLGLALAAVVSFTGAFGFSSTAALSAKDSQVSADTLGSVSTCPCGNGGPCCGSCPPSQRQN